MSSPEELARENIDKLLTACGWKVQGRKSINLSADRGVAVREALLKGGDEADYLLFVDSKAIGTVEAKPEGFTLTGVEEQSGKYGKGLLDIYPKLREPLPFAYESTGVETQFTNRLDPSSEEPQRLRLSQARNPARIPRTKRQPQHAPNESSDFGPDAHHQSLVRADRSHPQPREIPRRQTTAAPSSRWPPARGKTYTACTFTYRLIKLAGARRVLFLVDRANLGRPGPERIPAIRHARRRPQVHRALQRPAPHLERSSTPSAASASAPSSAFTPCCAAKRSTPRSTNAPATNCASRFGNSRRRSFTTRTSPSRPSTSSSPTNATAPSTISGGRCSNTSTPILIGLTATPSQADHRLL